MIATTYPLWNDKLYKIYITPLMDQTGLMVLLGT
jgi:hypothetical protein